MSKLFTPRSSSTTHRPDTHPHTHTEGLTLIEILVALAVSGLILTLVLGITNSSRALYEADQVRTAVNQNLRTAMDLIGSDVRVAGQGMVGSELNAILVEGGNELVIRTAPVDLAPLQVCEDINGDQNLLRVTRPGGGGGGGGGGGSMPANCTLSGSNDADGNGILDAFEAWIAFRQSQPNGEVRAALIDNTGTPPEFFTYDREDGTTRQLHKLNPPGCGSACNWSRTYDLDDSPTLFILEDRRYQFDNATGRLQLIVSGQDPIDLINNVTDFRVAVIMPDGTRIEDFGEGEDWTSVASVEISVTGAATRRGADAPTERTLTSNFYARNIRSRE